jgi:peptidoglycan/LPS O-acetylase OafA/YrhL
MSGLRSKIAIVEYLRGLAAGAVAWFHLTNGYAWGPVAISGSYGYLGVEVFFVISGFIIPFSIHSQFRNYRLTDYPSFVARRLLRLEPPYLVSIVFALALWFLSTKAPGFHGQPMQVETGQVLAHFLYLIPFTHYSWLQTVYWTLAYEFAYYLFIGLAFGLLCGRRARAWVWLVFAAALAAAVVAGVAPYPLMLFVIGIAAYRRVALSEAWGLTLVAILLSFAAMAACGQWVIGATGAATACLIILLRDWTMPGLAGRLLTRSAMISYSLYLTHVPLGGRVINLGKRFVRGELAELGLSLLALAVCVGFAVLFWWLVERPAIDLARSLTRHRIQPLEAS